MVSSDMEMGEFKGEVLATLKYLKEGHVLQSKELKSIKDCVNKHINKSGKAVAVLKYTTGVLVAWMSFLTMKFWR